MRVKLVTGPTYALVHETTIPPFQIPPDTVVWGDRTFQCTHTREVGADGQQTLVYRESFTFVIVESV